MRVKIEGKDYEVIAVVVESNGKRIRVKPERIQGVTLNQRQDGNFGQK